VAPADAAGADAARARADGTGAGIDPDTAEAMAMTPRIFQSTPVPPAREALDDTIEDSFPASDPPSSIPDPSYSSSASYDRAPEPAEGRLARAFEEQTARLPADTFLWAAVASMGVSAALQLTGKRHASLFVGQWAPAFLLLGIYNKLVKEFGFDERI
jgi:hypothetical protein